MSGFTEQDANYEVDDGARSSLWKAFRDNDDEIVKIPFDFLMAEFTESGAVYNDVWTGPKFRIPNNAKKLQIFGQMKVSNVALLGYSKLSLYVSSDNFSDEQSTSSTSYVDKTWTWNDISALVGQIATLHLFLKADGTYTVYAKADNNSKNRFSRA